MKKFDKLIIDLKEEDKILSIADDCEMFLQKIYGNSFECTSGSNCYECLKEAMFTLNKEYQEPYKLTKFEYELLKKLALKYKRIEVRLNGDIWCYYDDYAHHMCIDDIFDNLRNKGKLCIDDILDNIEVNKKNYMTPQEILEYCS